MSLVVDRRQQPKRSRGKQPPSPLASVFADAWNDEFVDVADQLCVYLDLPDLTTRSGLKKVHADITSTQKRLDQTFKQARRNQNAKVMGGVISIYTKMCIVDAILQDKLIQNGFLDRIVSLIDVSETRYIALRTLNAITVHSGKRCAAALARHTNTLVRLLKQNPHDVDITSLVIGIFCHCINYAPGGKSFFDLPALAVVALDALRHSTITDWMFDHAISLLLCAGLATPSKCREIPHFTTFCVALLRSKDLYRRMQALRSLFSIPAYEPEKHGRDEQAHPAKNHITAFATVSALMTRQLPPGLIEILNERGRDCSEILATQRASSDYMALHTENAMNPDILKLGRALAQQVLSVRFAIPQALCQCCARELRGGSKETWQHTVCQCTTELRSKGDPSSDLFWADVLEWKNLQAEDLSKATKFAREALARYPSSPFFYYAIAADAQYPETLRMAKKGLKCRDIPAWMRSELLRAASEAAFYMALREGEIENNDERVALLISAREDAQALIEHEAPDSIFRQRDLSMYILISLVVRGPKEDIDSPEIQATLAQMEVNEKFMRFLGYPASGKVQSKLTCDEIMDLMPQAMQDWGDMLERSDAVADRGQFGEVAFEHGGDPNGDQGAKALTAWLNKFEDETLLDDKHDSSGEQLPNEFPDDKLALLRCSWCSRTSALLRKCGRCGVTRYCDAECQKNHWKEHKQACYTEGAKPSMPCSGDL